MIPQFLEVIYNMEINVEERVQSAVEYFMQGYGCAQSVVAAFADIYGIPTELAVKLGAGFGGGVGKLRMMCGTVSGMVILAGLQAGQTEGSDQQGKAACYKVVQELLESFRVANGSVVCAELLGLNGPVAAGDFIPAERNAHYYKVRPCAAKVESAARIYAEYLAKL